MPDKSSENGVVTGGTFKWIDGVLLQAIKNGNWVLLDELNLASQSVLEGLNGCLDHRANKMFSVQPHLEFLLRRILWLKEGGGKVYRNHW